MRTAHVALAAVTAAALAGCGAPEGDAGPDATVTVTAPSATSGEDVPMPGDVHGFAAPTVHAVGDTYTWADGTTATVTGVGAVTDTDGARFLSVSVNLTAGDLALTAGETYVEVRMADGTTPPPLLLASDGSGEGLAGFLPPQASASGLYVFDVDPAVAGPTVDVTVIAPPTAEREPAFWTAPVPD